MAKSSRVNGHGKADRVVPVERARITQRVSESVRSGEGLIGWMSDLMCDLADDRVVPGKGNAICKAAGIILKTVDMQQKQLARVKTVNPSRRALTGFTI